MSYIYVKSGGTATGTAGVYSSKKTGSWSTAFSDPSQYYGDIYSAINQVTEIIGDIILVSNQHEGIVEGASRTLSGQSNSISLLSVNDTNLTELSVGAKESYSYPSGTMSFTTSIQYVYGITFEFQSDHSISFSGSNCILDSCTFNIPGNSTTRKYLASYSLQQFYNCTFNFGIDSTIYNSYFESGAYGWVFKNCIFIAPENLNSYLIKNSSDYDSIFEFDGCDFSQANLPLCAISPLRGRYRILVVFHRCKESLNLSYNGIYSGLSYPSGFYSGEGISKDYLATQYYALGIVDSDTSVYRTDGPEYASGYYFCYKVISDLYVTYSSMLSFKLLDFYLDTINPRTFTVEFAQSEGSTPLTDYQFSIDVFYIDDTTPKAIRETTTKILPSSTDLATSSKTWTGLTNPVKQYVSLTTSQTGSYGLCSVYVNIFVPNKIIYICPKVDIT